MRRLQRLFADPSARNSLCWRGIKNKRTAAERGVRGGQLKPSQGLIYGPDPDNAPNSLFVAARCRVCAYVRTEIMRDISTCILC